MKRPAPPGMTRSDFDYAVRIGHPIIYRINPPLDSRTVAGRKAAEREQLAKLRAPRVKTSAARRARLIAMERGLPGCGTDTQADRLLRALRTGPVTTHEARQYLDLPCPASRVLALRQRGYEFEKRWIVQAGPAGWFHKYVEYRLTGSGGA